MNPIRPRQQGPNIPISGPPKNDQQSQIINSLAGVLKFTAQNTESPKNWYQDAKSRFNDIRKTAVEQRLGILNQMDRLDPMGKLKWQKAALEEHKNALNQIRDEIGVMQKGEGLIGKIRLFFMKMQFKDLIKDSDREIRNIDKQLKVMYKKEPIERDGPNTSSQVSTLFAKWVEEQTKKEALEQAVAEDMDVAEEPPKVEVPKTKDPQKSTQVDAQTKLKEELKDLMKFSDSYSSPTKNIYQAALAVANPKDKVSASKLKQGMALWDTADKKLDAVDREIESNKSAKIDEKKLFEQQQKVLEGEVMVKKAILEFLDVLILNADSAKIQNLGFGTTKADLLQAKSEMQDELRQTETELQEIQLKLF